MFARIEVARRPQFNDPLAQSFLRRIELAFPQIHRQIRWARILEVYWVDFDLPRGQMVNIIHKVFFDPVQSWLITGDLIPSAAGARGGMSDLIESAPFRNGKFWGLEKRYRPGVTDNVGRSTREAFDIVNGSPVKNGRAFSGQLFLIEGVELKHEDLAQIARQVFCNELIESWTLLESSELLQTDRFQSEQIRLQFPRFSTQEHLDVEEYELSHLSPQEMASMSQEHLWALSETEMVAIQKHFKSKAVQERRNKAGLSDPTDVEMEVIAQTWSEHCKHKIFNARVQYQDQSKSRGIGKSAEIPTQIKSLFKETISGTTKHLPKDWLLSVFSDNAGIVAFDDQHAVCIKVETHNSPSALDPYGGALTGIVGVNRDILGCGYGAKPLFNTDVFCVAPVNYGHKLPERIMHPRRILSGVRLGVEHGGNQSGIPTINGALVLDESYLGKPLIFCGTAGILPRKIGQRFTHEKVIQPGDRIFMAGGRIGKDGIHGATFSSLAMDENSPVTAVQLGDPITQKRLTDFLIDARDQQLYRTLTDNGAGGLSSSVGELARLSNGARMDVSQAATKYPGLRPYELVVSESQERMTIAVPPENVEDFRRLAKMRNVEVSDLGVFTDSGIFEIYYESELVAQLDLEFLHEGNPQLQLDAVWKNESPPVGTIDLSYAKEAPRLLLQLLSRPNIASKEWLIRQYDHEVQGTSVIKPLHTARPGTPAEWSGPNDAGVIKPKSDSFLGLSVACGINPKYSQIDPYLMAQMVVDEAVRNVICVGSEYGQPDSMMALVDNFCWPDPQSDPQKMAALVRTCYGMKEAALELGTPFISGKDSMKNDYRGSREGKPLHISVLPTLLVTALGRLKDIRQARTAEFKGETDWLYLIGGENFGMLGSELHAMLIDQLKERGGKAQQVVLPARNAETTHHAPTPDWETARRIYRWMSQNTEDSRKPLKSVHDISEGGLMVALAESLLAQKLGADIRIPKNLDPWELSFAEGFHSFLVSAFPSDAEALENEWRQQKIPFMKLGSLNTSGQVKVTIEGDENQESWLLPVEELRQAWKLEGYWE